MFSITGAVLRTTFRANSADIGTAGTPTWPLNQYNGTAGFDGNADLYIAYDGYGPDVDETDTAAQSGVPADVDYTIEQALLPYADMGYTTASLPPCGRRWRPSTAACGARPTA